MIASCTRPYKADRSPSNRQPVHVAHDRAAKQCANLRFETPPAASKRNLIRYSDSFPDHIDAVGLDQGQNRAMEGGEPLPRQAVRQDIATAAPTPNTKRGRFIGERNAAYCNGDVI
jgi:hypothetical protein